MIIRPRTPEEYVSALRELEIINLLRERPHGYHPPIMADTPWIHTHYAKERYL